MGSLSDPIESLKGVGAKRAQLYHKLGVETVGDLLRHYPRTYQDLTHPMRLAEAAPEQTCCVEATVTRAERPHFTAQRTLLVVFYAQDGAGQSVKLVFFNNPYICQQLRVGDTRLFYGKVGGNFVQREMLSPQIYQQQDARLLPVYPLTAGLSSKMVITNIRQALTLLPDIDSLPLRLRQKRGLCSHAEAVRQIHFPQTQQQAQRARERLVFEELLGWQLGLCLLRSKRTDRTRQRLTETDLTPFLQSLPFALTGAQQRVINQCVADCLKSRPMNRLVQGDVGSGKTMVAAALCFLFARSGMQAAMMAPTDLLARQHFTTLHKLLRPLGIKVGLLVGSLSAKEAAEVRRQMADGEIAVAVGTHALFQASTTFANLGLVITDEQHRFGVNQRKLLAGKGAHPHMLVMSATPIPRTLALILYGDLDVSVIDELPAGRQAIDTFAIPPSKRARAFGFIRKHLDEGRQAYIVCPAIEQGQQGAASVVEYAEQLQKGPFAGYTVGVLHGRLPAAEKEQLMQSFASGQLQLLVATTVVEVGVDVPNAVVMLIENAELFGLSQLHQLRGRVGRGSYKSSCILVSGLATPQNKQRLRTMCETSDGFAIAQKDLELRGPGDFFGSRQHGLPAFTTADLVEDMDLLNICREEAEAVLERDRDLSHPENAGLREMVQSLFAGEQSVL